MRRIRRALATFLAVCMVCGMCGNAAFAAAPDMYSDQTDPIADTEESGKDDVDEENGGTENEDAKGETEEAEEEADQTENDDTGEADSAEIDEIENEGSGEDDDSGNDDFEESNDSTVDGDDASEEESDETDQTDLEETSGETTETGASETPEETISENDIRKVYAASSEAEELFDYTVDEKTNTVILNGYKDGNVSGALLRIPETLGGYPVVEIKNDAFKKSLLLETLEIPDSVETIGTNVFMDSPNLSSVTLPKGLKKLGYQAFKNCKSLTSIEIPKSLEGGTSIDNPDYGIFAGCDKLKNVTIETGTTKIMNRLFMGCDSLEEIVIPDTVTTIGCMAFERCTNLREITIPDSVTEIQWEVFKDCTGLLRVNMSDSVTTIGRAAFEGCTGLAQVRLSKGLKSMGYETFKNCSSLTAIEIPKSLETVEGIDNADYGCFVGCDKLTNITFEDGVTRIADHLFMGCTSLKELVIPDTVTVIEYMAFEKCVNLTQIAIPDSVAEIQWQAFKNCTGLLSVNLPDSVKTIGRSAFDNCTSLTAVTLSRRLSSMGYLTFRNCSSLTTIEIPKSLETVEGIDNADYGCFVGCDKLTDITFEDGVTRIADHLFMGCTSLKGIVIPDTVTTIEFMAFEGCTGLTEICIPGSVTTIEGRAFRGCTGLTKIELANGLAEIGNSAFQNCTGLIEIEVPDTVHSLGTNLLAGCTLLQTVILPDQVTELKSNAFSDCTQLSDLHLPECLQTVGNSAFSNCDSLTEIVLPDGVTKVDTKAFYDCDGLVKAVLPDSVTSLGTYVFAECELLNDVALGTGITTIPSYTFELCPSLEKIVLPYRTETIKKYAFKDSAKFTEITIPRATTTIEENAFSYPLKLTIYGVSGTYAETYADSVGAKFVNSEKNATEVRLNTTELKLANGKKTKLILSVTPSDFTDEVSWKSSAEDVVTVENTGEITAKKLGTATIKVTVGRFSASCIVTVTQPVTSINLNPSSLSLEAGDTKKLTATVLPDTAENKEIAWSTSDDRIASVDAQGTVTAHLKGTATITATAQDGSGISRSCSVEVKNNGYICNSIDELESPHDYPNNCSDYWQYTKEGAESLYVTFDARTEVEENFDFITIFDGGKKQIDKYTGTQLAGETVEVPGDTVRIQLVSDAQASAWGFKVTRVMGTGNVENDEYQVTFDTRGGMMISPVTVEKGAVLARPETPVKPGYQFIGWYLDGVLYDFTQPVTGNLVLVARWEIDMTGVGPVVDASIPEEDMPADGIIPEGLWIAGVKDQVYTGKAHKPEVRVYDGAVRLTEKTDYTISYKNNVKANDASDQKTAPTITVKGKGNYKGSATAVYKIAPVDLNDESIFISDLTLAHNGQLQKKAPTVTYGGKKLAANRDYTVTYPDTAGGAYTEVGTYTVEVTGKGNFAGTQKIDLVITDKTPIEKAKFVKIANKAYNDGNPVELSSSELVLYMKSKNEPLAEGRDYTVTYENHREIGTATAVIAGMGDYAGTKRITYKIVGTPINKATVEGIENKIYNGTEQMLDLTVKVNGTKLTLGDDYTVAYNKNENVGTASVTIQGINGYSGTVKKTFKITAYDLEKDEQNLITDTMAGLTVKYVKGGCKPQITVKFGETELVSGTDYTVTYQNNQNIADTSATKAPTVKIKGKGNFKGTRTGKFSIVKKNFNDPEGPVSISVADVAYAKGNGKYVSKPVLTDTDGKVLKAGTDYDVTYTLADGITKLDKKSTVAAGSYVCVTAKGKGKYEGALLAAYRITKANFAKASIKIAPQTYTGSSIYLTGGDGGDITVTIGRDQLVYGVDYEILEDSYTNNVKKGNAGVKIRGLGDYGGTKAVKFKIQPKEMQSFGSIVRALLFGTE